MTTNAPTPTALAGSTSYLTRPRGRIGYDVAGTGPRDPAVSTGQRLLLRVAMARPWAALAWKSYLPKLYAGQRPADFAGYRDQVVASLSAT